MHRRAAVGGNSTFLISRNHRVLKILEVLGGKAKRGLLNILEMLRGKAVEYLGDAKRKGQGDAKRKGQEGAVVAPAPARAFGRVLDRCWRSAGSVRGCDRLAHISHI